MCQCLTGGESNQIRRPWGNIGHVSLVFFPPFLEDDLLLLPGSVLLEHLLLIFMHVFCSVSHTPMHVQLLFQSVSLLCWLLRIFMWVTAGWKGKCISTRICQKDRPSSSHVSVASLQHHNRTHFKFQTWGCALWYANAHLLCTGSDAEWRNFSLFQSKTFCFKGICSFKTGD